MDEDLDPSEEPADLRNEEKVGYANPPKDTRWRKGHCPNPRGRPRNAKGRRAILERVANELCDVKVGNVIKKMTRAEVVLMAVRNATANGNPAAQRLFDKLLGQTREDGPPITKGVLITGEKLTADEWEAEFGHLGGLGRLPPPPRPIQLSDCCHLLPKD